MIPPLPHSPYLYTEWTSPSERVSNTMYTEAQLLDYRAAVIEACAAVCEATHQTAGYGNNYADKLRGLK